jgi:nitrite reductase/ring-hydroxylating ferredoxin subunit
MPEYVKVASVGDLAPGEMTMIELGEEYICLANVDGTFYAISDDCPHASASLSEGELEGYTLTCPVHAGQFDIRTGKVLRRPPIENVATYEVKIEGQDILIAKLH